MLPLPPTTPGNSYGGILLLFTGKVRHVSECYSPSVCSLRGDFFHRQQLGRGVIPLTWKLKCALTVVKASASRGRMRPSLEPGFGGTLPAPTSLDWVSPLPSPAVPADELRG